MTSVWCKWLNSLCNLDGKPLFTPPPCTINFFPPPSLPVNYTTILCWYLFWVFIIFLFSSLSVDFNSTISSLLSFYGAWSTVMDGTLDTVRFLSVIEPPPTQPQGWHPNAVDLWQIYIWIEAKEQSTDKKCSQSTRIIHPRWYRSWNGQNPTTGRFNTPPRRSHLNYGWKVGSDSQQSARRYMYD